MWEAILQPWPWYVTGPLIGLMVPLLLLLTGETFGISGSFRRIPAICMPKTKIAYFRDDNWKDYIWQLFMVSGIVIGGFVANHILSSEPVPFLPDSYYTFGGVIKLVIGGMLVGFGTRYANGCPSGHTIMGLSNLQWSSFVASICFFVGGLVTTWILWPLFN